MSENPKIEPDINGGIDEKKKTYYPLMNHNQSKKLLQNKKDNNH